MLVHVYEVSNFTNTYTKTIHFSTKIILTENKKKKFDNNKLYQIKLLPRCSKNKLLYEL